MNGSIEELTLLYEPGQLTERMIRRRRYVRSRVISLVITIVVLVAIYFWRRDEAQQTSTVVVYGIVLAISLGWLLAAIIRYLRARKQLDSVGQGPAVRMGRAGVQVADLSAGWPQVASIAIDKARIGRGPALRLRLTDGREAQVGLDQIEVYPATLDSTARAYSGGHHGVDLSGLDN